MQKARNVEGDWSGNVGQSVEKVKELGNQRQSNYHE